MLSGSQPIELLRHCPTCLARHIGLCQAISDADLNKVEKHHSGSRTVGRGQHIYHQGDSADTIYNLIDGWVMLYQLLPDGRRQVLEFLLPGAVIGFQPDQNAPTSHSAQCLTDATVCVFSRDQFAELLSEHAEVGLRLARICARTNMSLHDHLTSLGRRTARERTAYLLLEFYIRLAGFVRPGDQRTVTIPLTQEQIADALGLSRSRVNQILQSFADNEIVDLKRMSVGLRNPQALANIAGVSLIPDQAVAI